jgi:hypothetical protein
MTGEVASAVTVNAVQSVEFARGRIKGAARFTRGQLFSGGSALNDPPVFGRHLSDDCSSLQLLQGLREIALIHACKTLYLSACKTLHRACAPQPGKSLY